MFILAVITIFIKIRVSFINNETLILNLCGFKQHPHRDHLVV